MRPIGRWLSATALLVWTATMAQPAGSEPTVPALVKSSCASCHTFAKGEANGQGPNLFGLIGRTAGSAPGFAYSAGLTKALGGKTWSKELLDAWLTDTERVAPGSLMTFFLDDAKSRQAIVDYFAGQQAR